LWEQNETGLEREFSEDLRPTVLWWLRGLGYDPELGVGMVNQGHVMPSSGTNRPTAAEEVDLVISIDPSAEVQRQMQVQQARVRTGA